jgi:hypothetical protein
MVVLGILAVPAPPVRAAGTVAVSAWICPEDIDATGEDPAAFDAACAAEATGLTFSLSTGVISRKPVSQPERPISWPAVSGRFTITVEPPHPEPIAVFCTVGSEPAKRIDVTDGTITGELPADADWDCRWYFLPDSESATPQPPPTMTTVPVTATATATPAPSATQVPTASPTATPPATSTPLPTATPTAAPTATARPDPRATATAIAAAIADVPPTYQLPLHVLTYARGDRFKVYPDPGDTGSVGFAVEDFVLDVTFINPDAGPDGIWDYGLMFGPTDQDEEYYLSVRSDGRWFLNLGTRTLREAETSRLRLGDGENNTLRLIVADGRGIFVINGRYAGSFAVEETASRQVWLATTNIDAEDDQAFLDLSIWSFP